MNHRPTTSGERLAILLHDEFLSSARWSVLDAGLTVTGRGIEYRQFYQELTAVSLACRLIKVAASILPPDTPRQIINFDHAQLNRDLQYFLREQLWLFEDDSRAKLSRAIISALAASSERIPDGVRNAERRRAARKRTRCYLCGIFLVFDSEVDPARFTLDHIWPQSYGGESDVPNLLPACNRCNSGPKGDVAAWPMAAVQSVALGLNPSDNAIRSIPGPIRYAVCHLAAWRYANHYRVSLKEAFERLGPFDALRLKRPDDDCEFFNLRMHRTDMPLDEWD